ncbi:hypothetical protein Tco_0049142, partial [Tanacetum coccineum]
MINSIKDLREENKDMFSSINEAIKLMLAIATNMSCVVENDIGKEGSKDNLKNYSQEHHEGNALDPWILALEQRGTMILGENREKENKEQEAYRSRKEASIASNYGNKRAIVYMRVEKL